MARRAAIAGFLTLFVAAPALATVPPIPAVKSYVVWATPGVVTAEGGDVVDDYGGFVHAKMTEGEAASLREGGYVLEELAFTLRRASRAINEPVPEDLLAPTGSSYFVVQFRGPVKQEWMTGLQAGGARLIEYLHPYGFVVNSPPLQVGSMLNAPGVASVHPYHAAFRISTQLPSTGSFDATVIADRGTDFESFRQQVGLTGASLRGQVTSATRHILDVTVTAEQLKSIARIDGVLWIDPSYDQGGFDLNKSSAITQSGTRWNYSIHNQGINGSSQRIVVCDNGLENVKNDSYTTRTVMWLKHEVFNETRTNTSETQIEYQAHLANPPLDLPQHRKVLMYYSPVEGSTTFADSTIPPPSAGAVRSHGTSTSGVLAGDKTPFESRDLLDGIAYSAKLFFCDGDIDGGSPEIPNDYWNYLWPAWDRGATVASFQHGATWNSAYTEPARQMDEIVWLHRNLTVTWAIGNLGTQAGQRPETIAKSVVSVGGVENQPCTATLCESDGNEEDVHTASSRGPAADGRTKPNVVAPGFCVEMPVVGGYNCPAGTSYAAPAAGGAAALIRDYLHKGFYPGGIANASNARNGNVSSALVRAMLMASGRDLTGVANATFPNGDQGWGRVLLENVLYFANETNQSQKLLIKDEWESSNLTTGQSWLRNFRVNSGNEVRVFLAWSDYPGTVGVPLALVNDLDLQVGGDACNAGILNNVCNGNAWMPLSNETASGKEHLADHINVEEAVYLCRAVGSACAVPTGEYSVRVQAFNVPTTGGQPFALVITGDVEWV